MKRASAGILILTALAALGVGWGVYRALLQEHREQARLRLEAVADLKQEQVENWLAERRIDLALCADDPRVRALLAAPTPARRREAREALAAHRASLDYAMLLLLDARGELLLAVAEAGLDPAWEQEHLAAQGLAAQGGVVSPHRHGQGGPVLLDFVRPMHTAEGAPAGRLLVAIRPEKRLYPLIRHWVGDSATGEVLLARRDGDQALLLNEPRFRSDALLNHRTSLKSNAPMALALRLGPGRYQGMDYRGEPVHAEARAVAGAPWMLVAKMDQNEVDRLGRGFAFGVGLLSALAIGLAAGLAWLYWRRRQALARQSVAAARLARDESEARFRAIFDTALDGILVVDVEGQRFIAANPAICRLTGFSEQELLVMAVSDLHPADEMPRVAEEFARLRRDGVAQVVGIRVRRRDGRVITCDISASLLELEGRQYATGIFRDLSPRQAAEDQLRQDREHQAALREMLEIVLEGETLEATLERCLARLLEVSWLARRPSGAIHLAQPGGQGLELSVTRNLPTTAKARCVRLALGECLCGEAAARGEVVFSAHLDARHTVRGPDMTDHGHYCMPLIISQKLAGVLMVQLDPGAERLAVQEEFLRAAADTLAAGIQRHRVESALRRSEEELNLAQTVARLGSWALDVRSNVLTWSAEIYRIFAVAPGAPLTYETFLERVHPDDRAYVDRSWQAALAGEPYDIEHRIVVNGAILWVNERAQLRFDAQGALIGGIGMVQDITEQHRMQEDLLRLSLAVEQSPESIVITDLEGDIEYANAAFSEATGYRPEEFLGHNVRMLRSPETPPDTYATLRAALVAGQVWKGEFVNRRKDGSLFTEFTIISPIRQPDGRITHYLAIKEDISEKKRLGRELDRHRNHLEDLVATRTAELEQARREAEQLARVKSEFLANMSHEIRTPLNAVLGLARIGARENEGRQSGQVCQRILDAGEHLLGVINDILDFSKIEAGKMAVEVRPFRLGQMLDDSLILVRERAEAKGLALALESVEGLPDWVRGDPLRLRQILLNLLGNAVKFTEQGGVTLKVGAAGEFVRFRVEDSGIGLNPEQMERLFMPFDQGDTSTTRRYGGTGLGLTISRNLARLMGGDIQAERRPGGGSVFTLQLPLPETQAADEAQTYAGESRRLAGLRVLAADDVEVNRFILADLLAREGAAVVFAAHGAEAVERVREAGVEGFDVVLMDVQMPEMDGYEATRRIHDLAPHLPVIGLTAHALAEERERCLEAGMAEHVTKPVDADQLTAAIRRHVGGPRNGQTQAVSPADAEGEWGWERLLTRYDGRREFVMRLARVALDSHAGVPARLRDAARDADWPGLAFLAHGLKGLGGNLGCDRLRELAGQAEQAARQGRPEAAGLGLALADGLETLLRALETGCSTEASADPNQPQVNP